MISNADLEKAIEYLANIEKFHVQQGKTEAKQEQGYLMGWECPRCRTIHSPFVLSCGCPPPTFTSTTIEATT